MSRAKRLEAFREAAREALEGGETPELLRAALEAEIAGHGQPEQRPIRFDRPGAGE